MNSQQTLDGYNRTELHKIVDLYNLGYDLKKLQKNKADLLKELKKVPKKKLVDLPSKEELKKHKLKKKVPKADPNQGNIKDYFNSETEKTKVLTKEEMSKILKHSKSHEGGMKSEHIKNMIKFMKAGDTFNQAHKKAVKKGKEKAK
tara:strand:+ start:4756 stop:5193 length:438 start_codon:yes stop_codon:yes gene_type:complete